MEDNTHKTKGKQNPNLSKPGKTNNPNGRPKESILAKDYIKAKVLPKALENLEDAVESGDLKSSIWAVDKFVPALSSVEVSDKREEPEEDMSRYTDEQLRLIKQKKAEIEAIKNGNITGKTQA